MAAIFFVSSQPSLPSAPEPLLDKIWKKLGHIGAYAFLMWLTLRVINPQMHLSARHSVIAFAILLAYASSDEFHQSFVDGRTATWMDVLFFDLLGGCAGWVAYQRFKLGKLQAQQAWLYWLLFIGCLALLLMLNLPYPGQVEQNPARLLSDMWFVWGFNYFGLLLMPMAVLLIEDARQRQMRGWVYVVPYFVVGVLALSVYLARRKTPTPLGPSKSLVIPRWLWAALGPVTLALSVWLLPQGSWRALTETMNHNVGLWFMWLDIVLNQILTVPLVQSDMARHGIQVRWPWLLCIALTGPIGLGIYMAQRPKLLTIAK